MNRVLWHALGSGLGWLMVSIAVWIEDGSNLDSLHATIDGVGALAPHYREALAQTLGFGPEPPTVRTLWTSGGPVAALAASLVLRTPPWVTFTLSAAAWTSTFWLLAAG